MPRLRSEHDWCLGGYSRHRPITESEREGYSIPVDGVLLNHMLGVGTGDVSAN